MRRHPGHSHRGVYGLSRDFWGLRDVLVRQSEDVRGLGDARRRAAECGSFQRVRGGVFIPAVPRRLAQRSGWSQNWSHHA
jgi:hypothetical protein